MFLDMTIQQTIETLYDIVDVIIIKNTSLIVALIKESSKKYSIVTYNIESLYQRNEFSFSGKHI